MTALTVAVIAWLAVLWLALTHAATKKG